MRSLALVWSDDPVALATLPPLLFANGFLMVSVATPADVKEFVDTQVL